MRRLVMVLVASALGILATGTPAWAQAEAFLGEIRFVAFNYAPRGWAHCNGQILPINQNQALFSLLGTTYGGDGQTTFALPDLRGRVPIGFGQGPGLSARALGEVGGAEAVTLLTSEMPAHTHGLVGTGSMATATSPAGNVPAAKSRTPLYGPAGSPVAMGAAVAAAGGGQPHQNMPPFLALNCIIALQGIFPQRD